MYRGFSLYSGLGLRQGLGFGPILVTPRAQVRRRGRPRFYAQVSRFRCNPETPPRAHIFHLFSPPLSRPLAIEPPALELQRGELAVVVGERGVEVRVVHRRTVVDDHEVDEAGRGEKRLVNRDLSQAVGPSQVLHGVPRPGRSAEPGFNPRVSGLGNPRPE